MNKWIFCLINFFPLCALAQSDTLSANIIKPTIYNLNTNQNQWVENKLDTSLTRYHYFYPGYHSFNTVIGNLGTPIYSLEFNMDNNTSVVFQNNFKPYQQNLKGFIVSNQPYTKLFYSNGTKKEQYFNLIHSQRIKKGWNITAELDKINSDGFYANHKTDNTLAQLSSIYTSKNNRFIQLTQYQFSRYSNKENGGLFNDNDFESNLLDKPYLSTKLSNASNIIKTHNLTFENYFNLHNIDTDSSKGESYATLFAEGKDSKWIYKDNQIDSVFYAPFGYSDRSNIYDSLRYQSILGSIGWQNFKPKDTKTKILINIRGGVNYYNFYSNNRNEFNVLRLSGGICNNQHQKIILQSSVDYRKGIDNNFTNKINFKTKIGYNIDSLKLSKIWIYTTYDKSSPNYQNSIYVNEHLLSPLKEIENVNVGLHFLSGKWKNNFDVSVLTMKNTVYFDSLYQVNQYAGVSNLWKAKLSQKFNLKKVHLNISLLYQKVLGVDYFRVPEFTTFNTLYYESFLFKKAALMQLGINFYYNTSYYANGYFPMYRSFYIQDNKKIGNYPFFDVYITAKIKNARVYAKVTHLNSGFMGNTYYSIPGYPAADRMFRLGVDWTFWN